jgi:SAM-dependent methyltransferase
MTDKLESGLINFYNNLFSSLKEERIKLLELGVLYGESLQYFSDYFTRGEIIGFDWRFLKKAETVSSKISLVQGFQDDAFALRDLGNAHGPFNIIIDDCSHYGHYTQISFDFLFEYLLPGGYYIIEDWTAGFRSSKFRGIDKVLGICIENFMNYNIKEVRALKLPEGGTLAIIQKL